MNAAGTMLDAALSYAALGASVIPLHEPTKVPRVKWKDYQSRRATPGEIRNWWTQWPTANIGIITGVISGRAVLDVDVRNNGLDALEQLDANGGRMPDNNPLAVTGSNGLHHYFALDAPLQKAAPFEGIEVQADGALVVAPPSVHASGRRYQWLRPFDSPLPPVPDWLRWAVAQTTRRESPPAAPLADADRDDVLRALSAAGLYFGRHRRRGLHRIRCPWADAHSNNDPEAVVIEPGASPAPGWVFKCLHAHCDGRSIGELLDILQIARRRAS